MAGMLNKIKNAVVGGDNDHGSMGQGVGREETGVGKNTTSTPLFGSGDNHLGHSEQEELGNYQAKHGNTPGLASMGNTSEGAHHHGTTGTGGTGALGATAGGLASSRDSNTATGFPDSTRNFPSGTGDNAAERGILNPTGGLGSAATSKDLRSGTTGSGVGYGQNTTGSTNTGSSRTGNVVNKLESRIDSDRDGSRTTGGYGTTGSTFGSSTTTTGSSEAGYPHTHTGLHAADVISELQPGHKTEDSNVPHHRHNLYMSDKIEDYENGSGVHTTGENLHGYDNGRGGMTGTSGTGGYAGGNTTTGMGGMTGGTGTGLTGSGTSQQLHSSRAGNALDPRVDSDGDGSRLH